MHNIENKLFYMHSVLHLLPSHGRNMYISYKGVKEHIIFVLH